MGAIFSDDRKCRYLLWRELAGTGPIMSVGMINPSLAGVDNNDPTVTRVVGFADRLGCSKVYLWNLFASITPYVRELRGLADPVGPDNNAYIQAALLSSSIRVVAWGPLSKLPPSLRGRRLEVVSIARQLGVEFQCWDTAQDGQPKHPLMLPYSLQLKPWEVC
jgi:hypothetical protein